MTLPAGWTETTIGEVTSIRNAKVNPSALGTMPFIGLENIEAHTSRLLGIGSARDVRSAVARFERGDILYGRLRPYLNKVIEASFDGCASAEIIPFAPHEGICGPFVKRVMMSPEFLAFTASLDRGDRPRVSGDEVKTYSFPLPPLAEQRRIVAKLDALTAHITRARTELARVPLLVERYKLAILAAAFRGALTHEWRGKQQAQAAVQPRDESEIRSKYATSDSFRPPYEIPTSWTWLRLPELGELDRGKSRHRPRNDPRLFGGRYPFIQTGEVRQADRFVTSYTETYSDFGLAQSRLWSVGTVCITIAANIAETAILGIEACFPDSVVGFVADANRADASYVEFFLRTARADLQAFAPATAQKNINLDTLANIRLPMPPRAEQAEIVRLIEAAFARADRIEAEASRAIKLLDRLGAAILAKAFRGELVPQDPNDEPASALLARIRQSRAAASKPKSRRRTTA